MSNVKVEDLSPVPFFAHFLEGQFSKDLTQEQMKAIRGGVATTCNVTNTFPADGDGGGVPIGELPDLQELIRSAERAGQAPGNPLPPVTLAYPSDGENPLLY